MIKTSKIVGIARISGEEDILKGKFANMLGRRRDNICIRFCIIL